MKTCFRLSAVSVAVLMSASLAQAAPVLLSASIANNTDLGAGAHGGSFVDNALVSSNYQIDGANFSFTFANTLNGLSTLSSRTTGVNQTAYSLFQSGYSGSNYYYDYLRTVTTYRQVVQQIGAPASVNVQMGGNSVGNGSASMSSTTTNSNAFVNESYDGSSGYNGYSYYYGCGNYTCSGWQPGSWSYYYSNNYSQTSTQTQDWTGDFTVAGTVSDPTLLESLLTTGNLDFNLQVLGDVRLVGASLTLDVQAAAADPTRVPEPVSLALVSAALGGLAWVRRRRSS